MSHIPRFGLGFRTQHFAELTASRHGVDWLELLSDNYLGVGGPRRAQLEKLRADFPIALHGVSLGIANDAPPRSDYVAALRELADFVQPTFVSDHLCWTGIGGANSHDLLPVAMTREVLALVSERVARVQDALGRRILLENASAYVSFRDEEMSEAALLDALCERTGCGVLLDVNNLYVNAMNLGKDPHAALAALAPEHVGYMHVAGHALLSDVRIDTHGGAVAEEVWLLFEHAARRFPHAHVVLERDDAIPPLAELVAELDLARERWQRTRATKPLATAIAQGKRAAGPRGKRAIEVRTAAPAWREAQRAFWADIAAPAVGSASEADALALALDAHVPVSPQRGRRVYRDSYRTLPERALAANFPTLARVLSRRDFSALCAAFARAHPSSSHQYSSFGAPLPVFVETFELSDRYAVDREALADIARLEQAQLEAHDAPDSRALTTPAELAALEAEQWEDARFELAPSVRIVFAAHDVLPTADAVASGEKLPLPKCARSAYLVARAAGSVRTHRIDPTSAHGLSALLEGASFAEACERSGGDEAAPAVARSLALACALSALCAIHAPASALASESPLPNS